LLAHPKGETALHRASRNGLLEGVKYLIANGADPELKDNNGKTAYAHAMDRSITSDWSDENSIKVLYHLLSLTPNRDDPNLSNKDGSTALHQASYNGKLEVVKHLIASGADPNLKNRDGITVLQQASEQGHDEVVKHLIAIGAELLRPR